MQPQNKPIDDKPEEPKPEKKRKRIPAGKAHRMSKNYFENISRNT